MEIVNLSCLVLHHTETEKSRVRCNIYYEILCGYKVLSLIEIFQILLW